VNPEEGDLIRLRILRPGAQPGPIRDLPAGRLRSLPGITTVRIPHTIVGTEDPRTLVSPPLDTDDQFAFAFAMQGAYH
jgi:hypothetical protein